MLKAPMPDDAEARSFPPPAPAPPCGCDADPIEGLRRMFVDVFQSGALARGRDPATRPVFLRLHGVAHGTLIVRSDLPQELRVGVFGQKPEYPVWVRFSSDVQPGSPDLKGTVGIGLKLFGVEGEKILPPDQDASTQDFILQNHDVFFVDTAKDMCEFTCASLNGRFDEYVQTASDHRADPERHGEGGRLGARDALLERAALALRRRSPREVQARARRAGARRQRRRTTPTRSTCAPICTRA